MNKTIRKLAKTHVESQYLETLQGEWTATVTKASINMDAPVEQTFTSKIVIGPSALPEQLDSELKSRMMSAVPYLDASMADAFYNNLLMNQEIFNEDVRSQNQLLCVGFDFTNCDNHILKSNYGLSYVNFIKAGGENGVITQCLANPNFMSRTSVMKVHTIVISSKAGAPSGTSSLMRMATLMCLFQSTRTTLPTIWVTHHTTQLHLHRHNMASHTCIRQQQ